MSLVGLFRSFSLLMFLWFTVCLTFFCEGYICHPLLILYLSELQAHLNKLKSTLFLEYILCFVLANILIANSLI